MSNDNNNRHTEEEYVCNIVNSLEFQTLLYLYGSIHDILKKQELPLYNEECIMLLFTTYNTLNDLYEEKFEKTLNDKNNEIIELKKTILEINNNMKQKREVKK